MTAPHWDLGALLVAILLAPLVMSPNGYRFLQSAASWCLGLIWSDIGWCDSFCWADIPDGLLHTCPAFGHCVTKSGHSRGARKCWEQLLSVLFSRSWEDHRLRKVRKPGDLALASRYLRTDAKTLLTSAFLSANYGRFSISKDARHIQFGSARLQIFPRGDILVGHIEGETQACQTASMRMTKKEVEKILGEGYPPFYKEQVRTAQGHIFDYPNQELGWMARGGWIVAIGLSNPEPASLHLKRTYYSKACIRIEEIIAEDITPAMPKKYQDTLRVANNAVPAMSRNMQLSGLKFRFAGSGLSGLFENGAYTTGLTLQECQFAVSLFNRRGPLTTQEADMLQPILVPVLAAALRGMYHLVDYIREEGLGENAEELFNNNRTIFLTDCVEDIPW